MIPDPETPGLILGINKILPKSISRLIDIEICWVEESGNYVMFIETVKPKIQKILAYITVVGKKLRPGFTKTELSFN